MNLGSINVIFGIDSIESDIILVKRGVQLGTLLLITPQKLSLAQPFAQRESESQLRLAIQSAQRLEVLLLQALGLFSNRKTNQTRIFPKFPTQVLTQRAT